MAKDWYLYVVECSDESLYTGITTDLDRRIHQHNNTSAGARYTRARRPVELVAAWQFDAHSPAASAEYAFKQMERTAKLQRIDLGGEFEGGVFVQS